MMINAKTRYLLTFFAILLGSAIELYRGYRPVVVGLAFVVFLLVSFTLIYVSSAKEREQKRQRKRAYYAGETE